MTELVFVAMATLFSGEAHAGPTDRETCAERLLESSIWADARRSDVPRVREAFEMLERERRRGEWRRVVVEPGVRLEAMLLDDAGLARARARMVGTNLGDYTRHPRRVVRLTLESETSMNGFIDFVTRGDSWERLGARLTRFMNAVGAGYLTMVIAGWPGSTHLNFEWYGCDVGWTGQIKRIFGLPHWFARAESHALRLDGDHGLWALRDSESLRAYILRAPPSTTAAARARSAAALRWIRERYGVDLKRFDARAAGTARTFAWQTLVLLGARFEPFRREITEGVIDARRRSDPAPKFMPRALAALRILAERDYVWVDPNHPDVRGAARPAGWMTAVTFARAWRKPLPDHRDWAWDTVRVDDEHVPKSFVEAVRLVESFVTP